MNCLQRVSALRWMLILAVCIEMTWIVFVGYVRDDAYITFRYADNLAAGKGFVYNVEEHVYGTSSPGLALLLAGWQTLVPDQLVLGAWLLNIASSILTLVVVWSILEHFSVPIEPRICVVFVLVWSDKILLHAMEGMENPLVISCMITALYFMVKEKPILAGLAAGAMLWLRIDSGLWIVAIAIVGWFTWRRHTILFLVIASLVYLPWLIFAQFYFGSVIPFTVIAKQVAYSVNMPPWTTRANILYSWMTSFTFLIKPVLVKICAAITFLVAGFGAWTYRKFVFVQVLGVFYTLQFIALVALNMTVEQRYFFTSLYTLLILFGLGLHAIFYARKWKFAGLIIAYAIAAFYFALPRMQYLSEYQSYVYDGSLTQMGEWLQANSVTNQVVFLEPLGYVGYYAERKMFDEVGLITPTIVPLKRLGLDTFQIAALSRPDYLILHCDDAKRAPENFGYPVIMRYDPLGFEEGRQWENGAVQRNACYEIHIRE